MNIETSNHKIIKNKIGLLNLAEELGNVSRACRVMGYSRDTFYRYKHAKEEGGIEALFDANRRKPNLKNRVDERTENMVLKVAFDFPAFGQARAANELRKQGIFLSPAGVRCIWLRNGLESFKKRLKSLEERMAHEGLVLTESQLQALERKKDDDLAEESISKHM
jgi:transposase